MSDSGPNAASNLKNLSKALDELSQEELQQSSAQLIPQEFAGLQFLYKEIKRFYKDNKKFPIATLESSAATGASLEDKTVIAAGIYDTLFKLTAKYASTDDLNLAPQEFGEFKEIYKRIKKGMCRGTPNSEGEALAHNEDETKEEDIDKSEDD